MYAKIIVVFSFFTILFLALSECYQIYNYCKVIDLYCDETLEECYIYNTYCGEIDSIFYEKYVFLAKTFLLIIGMLSL